MNNKQTKITIFFVIVIVVLVEILLRIKGVLDFPVYKIESNGHYTLASNQSGSFLQKNQWFVNSSGFINKKELDTSKPYIILIGDSVVYGGNPVNYYDRIGEKLENKIKKNVYIGALGGWSLQNEIQFINKNIDTIKSADKLIIQFDSGDLSGLATAESGSITHPVEKPKSAIIYCIKKYIYPKLFSQSEQSELPPIPDNSESNGTWDNDLLNISKNVKGKILFVLYPDSKALENKKLWDLQTKEIKDFIKLHEDKFEILDLTEFHEWNSKLYRDGVHPNIQGNIVVADIIAQKITGN